METFSSLSVAPCHLAAVKENINRSKGAGYISVPFATIVVTLVRCSSVGPWLRDTNGRRPGQQAAEVILLEPFCQETRATGFLGRFYAVYAGWDAKTQ